MSIHYLAGHTTLRFASPGGKAYNAWAMSNHAPENTAVPLR